MVYQPNKALHPGLTILRILSDLGMTQKNLSERTGLSEKHLSQIVNGEASITVETALLLENAIGGSASFWTNLDKNYQEIRAKSERQEQLEQEAALVKDFPYNDLAKFGYVENTRKPHERVQNLWQFFGVNSLSFVKSTEAVAYRRQDGKGVKSEALAAWLRCGEIDSKKLQLNEYSSSSLRESIQDIKKLTSRENKNFFIEIQNILSSSGVGLVCVPHFTHTQVYGATRWIGKNPILQLSIRGKDADKFWFTLFHELGHVLKHGKKEEFLEFEDGLNDEKEIEADNFAQKTLIPETLYSDFVAQNQFSRASIAAFAADIEVDPGIVLGRLKHDRLVAFAYLSDLHSKLVISTDSRSQQ